MADTSLVGGPVIGVGDVVALGGIDEALVVFFDEVVGRAAVAGGCSQRVVREWVEGELLSDGRVRTQVLEGPAGAGVDGEAVVRVLVDAHVVRSDVRRGSRWLELAHDRLVGPVVASNVVWRGGELLGWQRDALVWDRRGRPEELLLSGEVLVGARRLVDEGSVGGGVSVVDRVFVEASEVAERRRVAGVLARRRLLVAGLVACVLAVIAAAGGWVAVLESRTGERFTDEIADARADAEAARVEEAAAASDAAAAVAARDAALDAQRAAAADASVAADDLVDAEAAIADADAVRVAAEERAADAATTAATARADAATAVQDARDYRAEAAPVAAAATTMRSEAGELDRQRQAFDQEISSLEECVLDLADRLAVVAKEVGYRDADLAGFLAKPTYEEMRAAIERYLSEQVLAATC